MAEKTDFFCESRTGRFHHRARVSRVPLHKNLSMVKGQGSVHYFSQGGSSPLIKAIAGRRWRKAERMVSTWFADVNLCDGTDTPPLQFAIAGGAPMCFIRLLVEGGALLPRRNNRVCGLETADEEGAVFESGELFPQQKQIPATRADYSKVCVQPLSSCGSSTCGTALHMAIFYNTQLLHCSPVPPLLAEELPVWEIANISVDSYEKRANEPTKSEQVGLGDCNLCSQSSWLRSFTIVEPKTQYARMIQYAPLECPYLRCWAGHSLIAYPYSRAIGMSCSDCGAEADKHCVSLAMICRSCRYVRCLECVLHQSDLLYVCTRAHQRFHRGITVAGEEPELEISESCVAFGLESTRFDVRISRKPRVANDSTPVSPTFDCESERAFEEDPLVDVAVLSVDGVHAADSFRCLECGIKFKRGCGFRIINDRRGRSHASTWEGDDEVLVTGDTYLSDLKRLCLRIAREKTTSQGLITTDCATSGASPHAFSLKFICGTCAIRVHFSERQNRPKIESPPQRVYFDPPLPRHSPDMVPSNANNGASANFTSSYLFKQKCNLNRNLFKDYRYHQGSEELKRLAQTSVRESNDVQKEKCAIGVTHLMSIYSSSFLEDLFGVYPDLDTEARDKRGNTPLHLAAGLGLVGAVRVLCRHGASVAALNKSMLTPLHLAAISRAPSEAITEVIRILVVEFGADVNGRSGYCLAPTPLFLALHHDGSQPRKPILVPQAEMLLRLGACVHDAKMSEKVSAVLSVLRGHSKESIGMADGDPRRGAAMGCLIDTTTDCSPILERVSGERNRSEMGVESTGWQRNCCRFGKEYFSRGTSNDWKSRNSDWQLFGRPRSCAHHLLRSPTVNGLASKNNATGNSVVLCSNDEVARPSCMQRVILELMASSDTRAGGYVAPGRDKDQSTTVATLLSNGYGLLGLALSDAESLRSSYTCEQLKQNEVLPARLTRQFMSLGLDPSTPILDAQWIEETLQIARLFFNGNPSPRSDHSFSELVKALEEAGTSGVWYPSAQSKLNPRPTMSSILMKLPGVTSCVLEE